VAALRRRFAELSLTAVAAVPFTLAYATVGVRAAYRWWRAAWSLGAERAGKRWPHAS
jgi:hypothetical protein